MRSPAWRATSYGARSLYVHLKLRWRSRPRNNGRLYLSHRDAQEEMGRATRDSISRWYRELEFYGFVVKTAEAALGRGWQRQGCALALDRSRSDPAAAMVTPGCYRRRIT